MGTYLSTPIVDKCEEQGEALACPVSPLVWGVVDMQGWRKSMEDSHVAQTNVSVPNHLQTDQDHDTAKVFGVFDGHGGAEVARFVQLYLVDVLTQQPTWQEKPAEMPASQEPNQQQQQPKVSPVGQALADAFHALDRMIGHPGRRDELIRLRSEKPQPGEQRIANFIPPDTTVDGAAHHNAHSPVDVMPIGSESSVFHAVHEKDKEAVVVDATSSSSSNGGTNSIEMNDLGGRERETASDKSSPTIASPVDDDSDGMAKETDMSTNESHDAKGETKTREGPGMNGATTSTIAAANEPSAVACAPDAPTESETATAPAIGEESTTADKDESTKPLQEPATRDIGAGATATNDGEGTAKEDDDSNDAAGKEDAAKLDQDLMMEGDEVDQGEALETANRKVTIMFQKLLSLGGNAGQMSLRIVDKETAEKSESRESPPAPAPAPKAIVPTLIQNGRQICNLPDHPIHAGCTAIVTVLIGRKLTIANAGDSRAVLCRAGGRMEPLSVDHKPQQEREMNRIKGAGGFVNQFGRVNGNLNLSRSIGDLKYKQVPGIDPAKQMITAEPDIVEVYVQSNDEFLILGCDGIWDCLTNSQCVKYVQERIDIMSPTEIGKLMLDEIISDDPRATQGIGGDNMTVMIVDFQPGKRSYRKQSEPSPITTN